LQNVFVSFPQDEDTVLSKANTLAEMGYSLHGLHFLGVPLKIILRMDESYKNFAEYREFYTYNDFMTARGGDADWMRALTAEQLCWSDNPLGQRILLYRYKTDLIDNDVMTLREVMEMADQAGLPVDGDMLRDATFDAVQLAGRGFSRDEIVDLGFGGEELLGMFDIFGMPVEEHV
jgi:hypothetical protein